MTASKRLGVLAALTVGSLLLAACGGQDSKREAAAADSVVRSAAAVEDCAKPRANCTDPDFRGLDLTGKDLSGARLPGAKFDGANLSGIRLNDAVLTASSWGPIDCDAPMQETCIQDWGYDTLGQPLNVKALPNFGKAGAYAGEGSTAREATLSRPSAIAFSGDSRTLYVADAGHFRVRAVDLSTGTVSTVAGTGSQCGSYTADQCGDGGAGTAAAKATFGDISGLAVRGTQLLVADAGTHVIRSVDLGDGSVTTFAGTGQPGLPKDGPVDDARLSAPRGMAVRGSHLLFADSGNNGVYDVDLDNGTISRVAGSATGTPCSDLVTAPCARAGEARKALLNNPQGVAIGTDGVLYVADTGDGAIRQLVPGTDYDYTKSKISSVVFSADLTPDKRPKPTMVAVNQYGTLFAGPANSAGTSVVRLSSAQISTAQQASRPEEAGITWAAAAAVAEQGMNAGGGGAVAPNSRYLATTSPAQSYFTLLTGQTGPNVSGTDLTNAQLDFDSYRKQSSQLDGFVQQPSTVVAGTSFAGANITRSTFAAIGPNTSFAAATLDDSLLGTVTQANFTGATWGTIDPAGETLKVTGSCLAGLQLQATRYRGWDIANTTIARLRAATPTAPVRIDKPVLNNVSFADAAPTGEWVLAQGDLTKVNFKSKYPPGTQFLIDGGEVDNVVLNRETLNSSRPSYTQSPAGWDDASVATACAPSTNLLEAKIDFAWHTGQAPWGDIVTKLDLTTDDGGLINGGTITQTASYSGKNYPDRFSYTIKAGPNETVVATGTLPALGSRSTVTTVIDDSITTHELVQMHDKAVLELTGPRDSSDRTQNRAEGPFETVGPTLIGDAKIATRYRSGLNDFNPDLVLSLKANSMGYYENIRSYFSWDWNMYHARQSEIDNITNNIRLRISDPVTGRSLEHSPPDGQWSLDEFAKTFGLTRKGQIFTVEAVASGKATGGTTQMSIRTDGTASEPTSPAVRFAASPSQLRNDSRGTCVTLIEGTDPRFGLAACNPSDVNQQSQWSPNGTIEVKGKCAKKDDQNRVVAVSCDPGDRNQQWRWSGSKIFTDYSGKCMAPPPSRYDYLPPNELRADWDGCSWESNWTQQSATPGSLALEVSWAAPAFDGGSPVTGYSVTSSPAGLRCATDGNTRQCTIKQVPYGTKYAFSIVPETVNGPGLSATTSPFGVAAPSQPTSVAVDGPLGSGEYRNLNSGLCLEAASTDLGAEIRQQPCDAGRDLQKFAWSAGALKLADKCVDVDNGSNADGTRLTLSSCNGSMLQSWYASSSSGVRNTETGRCIDVPGASTEAGARLQIWGCNGSPAQQLSNPAITVPFQALARWSPPVNDGGEPVRSYRATASGGTSSCTSNAPATFCVLTGLQADAAISVNVTAANGAGSSPAANAVLSAVATPPSAPRLATGAVVANDAVKLSWAPPQTAGTSPVTSYLVTNATGQLCAPAVAETSCVITGLGLESAAVTATLTIKAVNASGPGLGAAVKVVIPPTRPTGPGDIRISQTGANSVSVSWKPSSGTVSSYEVAADPGGASCTTPAATTACSIDGLATSGSDTTYTFVVTPRGPDDQLGTSARSQPFVVADVDKPSAPMSVTAVQTAATEGRISWQQPASTGGSELTGYTATVQPGGATCTAAAGELACAVTNLAVSGTSTEYSVSVAGSSASGSGTSSVPVTLVMWEWESGGDAKAKQAQRLAQIEQWQSDQLESAAADPDINNAWKADPASVVLRTLPSGPFIQTPDYAEIIEAVIAAAAANGEQIEPSDYKFLPRCIGVTPDVTEADFIRIVAPESGTFEPVCGGFWDAVLTGVVVEELLDPASSFGVSAAVVDGRELYDSYVDYINAKAEAGVNAANFTYEQRLEASKRDE